ncbi:MAG: sigma-70 family RNA polymerase sigma factor, partial [Nitrospirota bacterium]
QVSSNLDPELLARAAKGDQQAFATLYDRSSSLLFTLALRILYDRDEAADVLQEVYLEVWKKVVRYNAGRGSPTAWLVTLTRSRAIDRLRSRAAKGYGVTDSIDDTPAADLDDWHPGPFEDSADLELRTLVKKAFAELPEAQQQALELAYYQGLSHTEIAARLNQPLGTIKTRIQLGMNKLRATLRSCWGQE